MSNLFDDPNLAASSSIESRIKSLEIKLERAREDVREWTDANADLSRSAAEARAKNQGSGNGFMGALLGSKFRSVMRSGAAASNAAIAKEVAQKRLLIADGKRNAQDIVRTLQTQIKELKQELRTHKAQAKRSTTSKASLIKGKASSIDLLHKLKEAHEAGLLTDDEFQEKRKALVAKI
jgi:hypothetical protein